MIAKDGSRYLMWPIRFRWGSALSSAWFTTHGWQVKTEVCGLHRTSDGCMPGHRAVFGWTFHLGRLKVLFGAYR